MARSSSPSGVMLLCALSLLACGDKDGDAVDSGGSDGGDGADSGTTDGTDPDTDGDGGDSGDTGPVDADGDGHTADVDCDDGDPAVHPGADERCNDVDDDCDFLVDEDAVDATEWFTDADGDGVGSGTVATACTAPDGAVDVDGDCDDEDPTVYPGADELCDGVDNDCDDETGDAGVALEEADGTWENLTSLFDGATSESPASLSVTGGTVHVCEGVWYGTWDLLGAEHAVEGHGARESVKLDGAGSGTVLALTGEGALLEVTGVTLQHGQGDVLDGFLDTLLTGGGIACVEGSSVFVADSVVRDNHADVGGGLYAYLCDLDMDNVLIQDNSAEYGGGAYVVSGSLVLTQGEVQDNTAEVSGGGVGIEPYERDAALLGLELSDSAFLGNLAAYGGGLALFYDLPGSCQDSRFHGNEATELGGAIYFASYAASGAQLTVDACDFGAEDGDLDNTPHDLFVDGTGDTGAAWDFEEDASFECVDTGCVVDAD